MTDYLMICAKLDDVIKDVAELDRQDLCHKIGTMWKVVGFLASTVGVLIIGLLWSLLTGSIVIMPHP